MTSLVDDMGLNYSNKPDHVDVLVIGAGPTGSMCAYSLMKAGLSVRIIDQK